MANHKKKMSVSEAGKKGSQAYHEKRGQYGSDSQNRGNLSAL